jgi:dTDP-4-dehydrorhamnose 3,5-epimerase
MLFKQKTIGQKMIEGVLVTPLKKIPVHGGDVYQGMKSCDRGYKGFGEAYFSTINHGNIKAWKRHRLMQLNLIVPFGEIGFVLCEDMKRGEFQKVILSLDNYSRLTVPPMIWFGFKGLYKGNSILLNIANIKHDPNEVDVKLIDEINYDWRIE